MRKTKSFFAALLVLLPCCAYAELAVIVNKDLPITNLSREEIYRIYLGKTKFLPNGAKVIPVDQGPGTNAREKFYAELIKKSETDMKSYWSRVIFTGQGNPPIQESDDRSVKELVSKNPSFMGYIDKSVADKSVKVVYTLP